MKTKRCPDCHTVMVKVGHAVKWWSCPNCGATAPLRRTPTVAPDSSLRLGPARRAWLVERYGGIQQGIKALIDHQMWLENYAAREAALADDLHPTE